MTALGAGWALFPMNMRGAQHSFTDTMHLALGAITMTLLAGAIVTGASTFGRAFRAYSAATLLAMLIFFSLIVRDVPSVGTGLPTPHLGINERISMAAWLLWTAIFSIRLVPRASALVSDSGNRCTSPSEPAGA